jgi:hypothetical protein
MIELDCKNFTIFTVERVSAMLRIAINETEAYLSDTDTETLMAYLREVEREWKL